MNNWKFDKSITENDKNNNHDKNNSKTKDGIDENSITDYDNDHGISASVDIDSNDISSHINSNQNNDLHEHKTSSCANDNSFDNNKW